MNIGALFTNENSTPENKQPLFRGELEVGGEKYNMSSWSRYSKKGQQFLSCSVKPRKAGVQAVDVVLFNNNRHINGLDDGQPEYTGILKVAGKETQISAHKTTSKSGMHYIQITT
jgi:hypothetical protein